MFKTLCKIFVIFLSIFFFIDQKTFADPVHVNDIDVSAEMNHPTGVVFSKTGNKMFVAGFTPNNGFISQIPLSIPFDTKSAGSPVTKNLGTFTNRVQDIKFNSDGTKLFLLTIKNASNKNGVDIWTLSAPYDISNILTDPHTFIQFGNNTRGFDFNSDGTKMFVLESVAQTIDEYSVNTPYDLSNITKTASITNSPGDAFHQGFGLSADGYKMFVVKADKNTNDPELNTIEEYNLTSPFDLKTAVLNEDKNYNSKTLNPVTDERIAGITFNFSHGANKLYYTDFHESDLIREFDLPCAYGVISCPDPTKDKDDVAMVEAQAESAKKLIQHTTYPVLNRMEWLRRNKDQVRLSNQNIDFSFSNEILNSLTKALVPIYLNEKKNNIENNNNWSFWSEGSISIGKVGDTSTSSSKDINTTGLTFGADKKYENNILKGVALRIGADDVDIGRLGSALDMKAISLTFYETRPRGDSKFFDNLFGISLINSKLTNNSGSVSTSGERDGRQIFGSFSFRDVYMSNFLNFTPELKLNYGVTHYAPYEETGASGLNLRFGSQMIGTLITSIGSSIDKKFELTNGTFVPFVDFDYSADISPSSEQKISYASNGQSYILQNINDSTHNIHGTIGFDLITNSGITIVTKYLRDQSIGSSHSDSFTFGLDYKTSKKSLYTVSMINTSLNLSHKKELNLFNIDIDSNYDLFKDEPEYGFFIKVSNEY